MTETRNLDGHELLTTLTEIGMSGNRVAYVWPLATNLISDRLDMSRCDDCGRAFVYGKRGYNPITKHVRHMFDCENPANW